MKHNESSFQTSQGSSRGTEGRSGVKNMRQKKDQKSKVKSDVIQPRFIDDSTDTRKRPHVVSIEDIRDLVLHVVTSASPPKWLRIDNVNLIQKTVAIFIPGLTQDILELPPLPTAANPNIPTPIPLLSSTAAKIPFIATTFTEAYPTRAPGDRTRMHSVISSLFTVPVSGGEKKRRTARWLNSQSRKDRDPSRFTLSLEQMIENGYPIPSYMGGVFEIPSGWVETPQPRVLLPESHLVAPKQLVFAIDCEMCRTEDGRALTRVCMVDFHSGVVVYDQLVKPSKPITDYRTQWSGVTAEMLVNVTNTHAQAQAHILQLLSPPAPRSPSTHGTGPPVTLTPILLGHSLESDLKALKICHPLCIDTSVIYHHPSGRPLLKPGLAWLTKRWCKREIQNRGELGHDPNEDARACVDLLKKKMEGGPGFGEFKIEYESIFERMERSNRRGGGAAGSIRSAVVDHGNIAAMHGRNASTAVGCSSDEEVVKELSNVVPTHHVVFARLMNLANIQGWSAPKATSNASVPPPSPLPTPVVLTETIEALNAQLVTIYANLPPQTAVIIFTGHSDPRRMATLKARKTAVETALKSGKTQEELGAGWSEADGKDLEGAVELAKRGLLFWSVKQ